MTQELLLKKFKCTAEQLPLEPVVVKMAWATGSATAKSLLPVDAYRFEIVDKAPPVEGEGEELSAKPSFKRARIEKPVPARSRDVSTVSVVPICDPRKTLLLPPEDRHWQVPQTITGEWEMREFVHFRLHPDVDSSATRLAAFDVDDTIIETVSGRTSHTSVTDWKFRDDGVLPKLRELIQQGFQVVFMSNQMPIYKNEVAAEVLHAKIDAVIRETGLPIDYFCSVGPSIYRKPGMGMFQLAMMRYPAADLAQSFFVGDAAGRPKSQQRSKDFSDSDYCMALNLGIPFYTPEAFFCGDRADLHVLLPTPNQNRRLSRVAESLVQNSAVDKFRQRCEAIAAEVPTAPEIVLIVAPAACGKTTLSKCFPALHYTRVNQDELKTRDKCLAQARALIVAQRSVVVDNTNVRGDIRAEWVALAHELKVSIRCIVLRTPKPVALLLAKLRLYHPHTPPVDRREVERVVINEQFENFDQYEVEVGEGFHRVDKLDWAPQLHAADPVSSFLFDSYLP